MKRAVVKSQHSANENANDEISLVRRHRSASQQRKDEMFTSHDE